MLHRQEQFLRFWSRERTARPAGHPQHPLLVTYEDLRRDAAGELRRIAEHWSLDLGDDDIAQAVDLAGRDRMVAKAGGRENARVTVAETALPLRSSSRCGTPCGARGCGGRPVTSATTSPMGETDRMADGWLAERRHAWP